MAWVERAKVFLPEDRLVTESWFARLLPPLAPGFRTEVRIPRRSDVCRSWRLFRTCSFHCKMSLKSIMGWPDAGTGGSLMAVGVPRNRTRSCSYRLPRSWRRDRDESGVSRRFSLCRIASSCLSRVALIARSKVYLRHRPRETLTISMRDISEQRAVPQRCPYSQHRNSHFRPRKRGAFL